MEHNLTYEEIITRIAIYRNKRKISARELALRIGRSVTYFYKVENGSIILNLPTFLQALDALEVSTEEFFYGDYDKFADDAKTLKTFNQLTPENRGRILDLISNLK